MARPRTTLGTAGKITVTGEPGRYRARARFRDSDGALREVERFDTTKAKAENKLKAALAQRAAPSGKGATKASTSLQVASERWLSQVQRSTLAANTKAQYVASVARYLLSDDSTVKGLTLGEVNDVVTLETYLATVADAHGTGAAKTARSILSGILSMAVRDKAIPTNLMREAKPQRQSEEARKAKTAKAAAVQGDDVREARDTTRALTAEEWDRFLTTADSDPKAQRLDVADIAWFMAGVGCRISEALGQRWEDVNLDDSVVLIHGTKTAGSTRLVAMPDWLTERLGERAERMGTEGLLFPSPGLSDKDKPRERRNVARVFRSLFDDAGLGWATPHALRRTVATTIDAAGLPVALAADMLGHANVSMTQRYYFGRRSSTAPAAAAMSAFRKGAATAQSGG